jgi:hypothetical protein
MRILHVDSGKDMQGGQWQVLYLLRGLRDRGYDSKLLAAGELLEKARGEKFNVDVASQNTVKKFSPGADLVHVHDAKSHTWAAVAHKRPIIVSRRVGFAVQRNVLSRWKYGRARHYIAVSKYVSSTLVDAGLKTETISVVYDGVPIEAFREPAPNGPVGAVLKGEHDPSTMLVKSAAKLAELEIVSIAERRGDLTGTSVFAYITEMQGLGSGALVAMAAGVPVIASRIGGLPEIVEHERTGLLVNNELQEIAAALTRLTTDRDLALRLARNAYDRATKEFSVETMVRGTERVYEKVLATR